MVARPTHWVGPIRGGGKGETFEGGIWSYRCYAGLIKYRRQ